MPDRSSNVFAAHVREFTRNLAIGLGSFAGLVAIWFATVTFFNIPDYVLPSPTAVLRALIAGLFIDPFDRSSFWYQLASTLQATLWGFAIGSLFGILCAGAMSQSDLLKRILFPYLVGFQSMPKVALAPLFIIWFGFQIESKIAMSATVTFFPVLLNSLEGFTNVERERLELMASLDASGWQTFRLIRLPTALPFIFAGLNLGIVYALLGTIVAEFIGAQRGMGVMITQLQSVSDTAGVFAAIITLSVCGYVLIAVVRALQRRFAFWADGGKSLE